MALKSTLGFGMMRLPVKNGDPTDFDYEQLNEMVDTYLAAGYNYFDTSYVYHNGRSEEAVREAVVKRHPRESIRIATKFPPSSSSPVTRAGSRASSRSNWTGWAWTTWITICCTTSRPAGTMAMTAKAASYSPSI